MTVFFAAVLAHFLSDFVLQSHRLAARKRQRELWAHLAHGGVVTGMVIALALVASGRWLILLAVSAGLAHVVQDWAKAGLRARWPTGPDWLWLVADQILHLVVLAALFTSFGLLAPGSLVPAWLGAVPGPIPYEVAILVVLGTWVAGFLLEASLKPLLPRMPRVIVPPAGQERNLAATRAAAASDLDVAESESFTRTSFWIGAAERVIVIAAVAVSGAQGLTTAGLVVAAKSVFRWREIDRDPHAAQYFLLGTLLSIAVAVLDGLLIRHVMG